MNKIETVTMKLATISLKEAMKKIDTLEAQNAIMREALQAVEWVRISTWDINGSRTWLECAWVCGGTPKKGHASDCPRQVALGIK